MHNFCIKARLLVILITYLTIFSFQSKGQVYNDDQLILEGSITNIQDTIPYVYANLLGKKTDSAKVINGKYKFVWNTSIPVFITLLCKSPAHPEAYTKNNIVTFLTEPTTVYISSTLRFSNIKVSKSKAYIEYLELEEISGYYRKQLSVLFSKLKKINESSANLQKRVQVERTIDSVKHAMCGRYLKYITQHPQSLIKCYALAMASGYMKETDIPQVTAIYNQLPELQQLSYEGKSISQNLKKFSIKLNSDAPLLKLKDTSGATVTLNSYKEKLVLLDFWASWCIPCRKETPLLVELYHKYKNKGFEIVSVSLDSDRQKWAQAIKTDKMIWTNISDLQAWESEAVKKYKIYKIPNNFLINPSGKIIAKDVHGAQLKILIDEYLNSLQVPTIQNY